VPQTPERQCYRYGGDEFSIIMPETNKQKAQIVVERIRSSLSQCFSGEITASIGIAELTAGEKAEDLFDKADHRCTPPSRRAATALSSRNRTNREDHDAAEKRNGLQIQVRLPTATRTRSPKQPIRQAPITRCGTVS
jgi:GGDEF domain-containing protein